jgi:hypothetical protein
MDAWSTHAAHREIAGSPARRRGNFLLRGQKKVTKEKALNRTPAPTACGTQDNDPPMYATRRPASLSPLSLSPGSYIAAPARPTRGCTPCSRKQPNTAALGRRGCCMPVEPGVQPALTSVKRQWMALVTGTAARAQRLASVRKDGGRSRAPLMAASGWRAVERLFFGDFLLAPQKKVTRPPGRTPGTVLASKQGRLTQPSRRQS